MDEDGALHIADDVEQAAFSPMASFFWTARDRSVMIIRIVNRALGELILNYKSKFNLNIPDAVEALGLDTAENSMKSLSAMVRVVQRISPEVLSLEGLTHNHFCVATSFQGPKEPERMADWKLDVEKLLRSAAECPETRNSTWIGNEVRELQKRYGLTSARPPAGKVLLDQYARLCYVLEHWTPEQFTECGHSREKVLDYKEHVEGELLNRCILAIPEPKNFVAPYIDPQTNDEDVLSDGEGTEAPTGTVLAPQTNEPSVITPTVVLPPEDEDEELPTLE